MGGGHAAKLSAVAVSFVTAADRHCHHSAGHAAGRTARFRVGPQIPACLRYLLAAAVGFAALVDFEARR